jgi:Leucine-rich repeat (LRR) protein
MSQEVTRLELADNNVTGPLPASIGALTSLALLDLGSNAVTYMPTTMAAMTSLTHVVLNGSPLDEDFEQLSARVFSSWTRLTRLVLTNTGLTGRLPSTLPVSAMQGCSMLLVQLHVKCT